MRCILLSMLVACAYRAGSFAAWGLQFDGWQTTIGCIDLSIDRRVNSPNGPVLAYAFGNRCDRSVVIDLQHATVVARTGRGDVALLPYDPEHEIRALPLDGRSTGVEAIAYQGSDRAEPFEVCIDASTVVDLPFHEWRCFDQPHRIAEAW